MYIRDCLIKSDIIENLDILPSNVNLAIEIELIGIDERVHIKTTYR